MSKELAREKGIEGYIKKKYPQVYEFLRAEADKKGKTVTELLVEYANYGASIKKWGSMVTLEDLKDVDPKALYVAIKLLNWASQQYFTTLAYANVSAIQAMHQLMMQQMTWWQSMYATEESGEGKIVTPPMPSLPPQRASKLDKLVELIIEGIRAFNTTMQQGVQQNMAKKVGGTVESKAKEIAKKVVSKAVGETNE